MAGNWRQQVAPDWVPALEPMAEHLASIGTFLRGEIAEGRSYLPASEHILAAFSRPLAQVRVLIVGQDPYPTPGDPVGLSFSVPRGRPMPRSLLNIARELEADTGERLLSGDLSHWADQGVLLLNRCLTVRPGEPGSHRRQGWEEFTAHAIATVAAQQRPLVAILWGNDAQQVAPMLEEATVIASPHPSPLSASRGFFGSRPFSRVNAALAAAGSEPIRWGSPATGATEQTVR